ncbi:hypothetical protein DRP77_00655 [Candidatus Poribacteria bacterium]|nr:MAG: hypothetical protein DRP77_00655 [Candidatus Poribacteria bacterium]
MLERIPSRVPNLDKILGGGIPRNSIIMISGAPGTGKTVLASQIAFPHAPPQEKALIITTASEPLQKTIRFIQQFSFFDVYKVGTSVIYEDIGPILLERGIEDGIDRILELVDRYDPSLLVIDTFKALSDLATSADTLRRNVYRLAGHLSAVDCTTLLIGEYQYKDMFRLPEFVIADGIIELINKPIGLRSYRSIRVLKLRGSDYISGEHALRITSDGLIVFPRFVTPPEPVSYEVSLDRCLTGIDGLDELFGGGILKGTTTLVAGEPGTGKTVTALHFLLNGAMMGEKGVYVSFQEDPNQLRQIALNFGFDLSRLESEGLVDMFYTSPVELDIDEHIMKVMERVERIGANRIVIDSVGDLEAGAARDHDRYFNYVYSMVQYFKNNVITAMLTAEMSEMFGSGLIMTGKGISHVADNVIILRYVEIESKVRRALTVLKARGCAHSNDIREYVISERGIRVGESLPFVRYAFSNLVYPSPRRERSDEGAPLV